jgi:hypothetical protein
MNARAPCLLVALSLLLPPALAQPLPAHTATRAQAQAEIQRLSAAFAAEEAACAERFAVSACVDNAKLRRRDALAPWRARQLALDDAERRERAAARLQAIEAKQREAAARPPAPPASAAPPRARLLPPAVPPARHEEQAGQRQQASEEAAAQRAAASEQRRRKMHDETVRIRSREAEAQQKKRGAPLPVPPVPPASAASR